MGWVGTVLVVVALGVYAYTEGRRHVFGVTFDHRTYPPLGRPWQWAVWRDGRRPAGGSTRWWITAQFAARWVRAGLEAQYERDRECRHAARAQRVHGGRR